MYAERLLLETDTSGRILGMPLLPPNKHLEAIFLVIDKPSTGPRTRRPHKDIIGRMKILGDIMSSAPESDWSLPR